MKLQLSVEGTTVLKNASNLFDSADSIWSELIQNARRAGSPSIRFETKEENKQVTSIRISDIGDGIKDLTTLFRKGVSGWSDDVVSKDQPFGFGFLVVLLHCEKIIINSLSKRITLNTKDLLEGKVVEITAFDSGLSNTQIEMFGLSEQISNAYHCHQSIRAAAMAQDISVYLNGEELERPYSDLGLLDSGYDVIETEFGQLWMPDDGKISGYLTFTLQGIKLPRQLNYAPFCMGNKVTVLKIDTSKVTPRWPDRTKLVDEDKTLSILKGIVLEALGRKLPAYKEAMAPVDFVRALGGAALSCAPELLDDMDFLPASILSAWGVNLPSVYYDLPDHDCHLPDVIHRDEIRFVNSRRFDLDDDTVKTISYLIANGVYYCDRLEKFSSEHWIHDAVVDFDIDAVSMHMTGCKHFGEFEVVDKLVLKGPLGETQIIDTGVATEDRIVIPKGLTEPNYLFALPGNYENEGMFCTALYYDEFYAHKQALEHLDTVVRDPSSVLASVITQLGPGILTYLNNGEFKVKIVDGAVIVS